MIVSTARGIVQRLSWETTRDLALIPADFLKQIARVPSQQITNHLSARDRLIAKFPKVFDGILRVMPGEVFTIQLKDDARPFCVNTLRRVSFAYREPLKEQLDTLTIGHRGLSRQLRRPGRRSGAPPLWLYRRNPVRGV